MSRFLKCFAILGVLVCADLAVAQTKPSAEKWQIDVLKAEDELRFDSDLKRLLESKDSDKRKRAALAAGRIGGRHSL